MIRRTVLEWQKISYGDGEGEIPEVFADRIAAAALTSPFARRGGGGVLEHGRNALRARGVVGVIAVPGCALEILPKIEGLGNREDAATQTSTRDRLIHMLAVAYDLGISTAELTPLGLQRETILDALIARFADLLADAVRRGMPRSYLPKEEDLPALRGRLDVARQFTALAASPQLLACRYDALSPDIALNRIMKAVVLRLSDIAHRAATLRKLADLAFAYADVGVVPVKSLRWDEVRIDRSNARWKTLVRLARLLLSGNYQNSSGDRAEGFALLFDMSALFEAYVSRLLGRLFVSTSYRVVAQGGRKFCLNELKGHQIGAPRFLTKPDIMILNGDRPVLIIDTKWKRLHDRIDEPKLGVRQTDIYQMMAYGQIYKCAKLMLLYPYHGALHQAGVFGRYRVNGNDDLLVIATLDMAQNRDLVESQMAAFPDIGELLVRRAA